jgi:hypothetical protein
MSFWEEGSEHRQGMGLYNLHSRQIPTYENDAFISIFFNIT